MPYNYKFVKNNRLAAVIIALVFLFAIPLGAQAMAGQSLDDISDVFPIDHPLHGTGLYLGEERLESNSVVSKTDTFLLRYDFEISTARLSTIQGNADKVYEIPLPNGLVWIEEQGITFPIAINITETVKKDFAEVKITGGVAYITFEGDYWTEGHWADSWIDQAFFRLPCKLAPDVLDKESFIADLLSGDDLVIYILENQLGDHEAEKEGAFNSSTLQITWQVTYNPGAVPSDYPLTLSDSFDNAQQILVPGSLIVTKNGVDITDEINIDHTPGKTSINYVMEEYNPEEIKITYKTRFSDAELMPPPPVNQDRIYRNTVTLTDDAGKSLITPVTEEVEVPWQSMQWFTKTGGSVPHSETGLPNRQISWTVNARILDRVLDNLVIKDIIPAGLTLEPDTIRVISNDGGAVLTKDTDYIFIAPVSPGTEFSIVLNNSSSSVNGYRVEYRTTVDEKYFDEQYPSVTFTNIVWADFNWHRYGYDGEPAVLATPHSLPQYSYGVNVVTSAVLKGGSYDPASGEFTWRVNVNPYRINIAEGRVTEDIELNTLPGGQTYVEDSLTIPSESGAYLTFNEELSTDKLLIVDVGDIGTGSGHYFTFRTTLDNRADFAANIEEGRWVGSTWVKGKWYYNTARIDYKVIVEEKDNEVESYSTSDSASVWVTSRVIDKESTGYNYRTQKATWEVTLNENRMKMTNVVLTDTVLVGQMFTVGSVRINGSPVVPEDDIEVIYNINELIVKIPVIDGIETKVTYETQIDPDGIFEFQNEVVVEPTNRINMTHDLFTEGVDIVSDVEINNVLVDKSGVFNGADKSISYTININPNAITIKGGALVDTIPPGLRLDITSVTLWNADIEIDGTFTNLGTEKFKYDSPAFIYTPNDFTLMFPDGNGRYILTYDCYITNARLSPFVNEVILDDQKYIKGKTAESEDEVDIRGDSGTGVSSKRVSLEVEKVDSERTGVKLPGVKLELYQKIGPQLILIMEETTDSAGKASFYPLKQESEYLLRELSAPAGYDVNTISAESAAGIQITGKEDNDLSFIVEQEGGVAALQVKNDPKLGTILFEKTSDRLAKGVFLPVAEGESSFRITDRTPGSNYVRTITTDASGLIKFLESVPFGVYDVVETVTPIYHTTAAPFRIEIDAAGNTLAGWGEGANTVANVYFRPDYIITKTKANGTTPVENAVFELCDSSGNSFSPAVTAQTDSAGKATFFDLYGGASYLIKELSESVPGYYVPGERAVPTVNQAGNYAFTWQNYEHAASLEITKVDVMRPGVVLQGASYELYGSDPAGLEGAARDAVRVRAAIETGANGKLTFTELPLAQNTAALSINAEPALLATDYWLVETIAPAGYDLAPAPVKVTLDPAGKANGRTFTYTATVDNEPTHHTNVSLAFTKVSSKATAYTLGESAMPGIVFTLIDRTTESTLTRTGTSDGSGVVTIEDIPFGNYWLRETGTPAYHRALADIPVTFDINGVCTSFNGVANPTVGDFKVTNEIFNPSFNITKTNSSGAPIPNVTFELLKADGSSLSPAVTATTDAVGKATLAGLVGGDAYKVKELGVWNEGDSVYDPLPNHYLNGDHAIAVVNQAADYNFTWRNYEYAASLEITKVDKERQGVLISGAAFELYRDDGTGEDYTGDPIRTGITEANGKLAFTGLPLIQDTGALSVNSEPALSETIYWIVEKPPVVAGYILSPAKAKVAFSARAQALTAKIDNAPVTADFDFIKYTDRDAGTTLGGAVFRLTDTTSGSTRTYTAASQYATGLISFTDIPWGRYLVEETTAPDYHTTITPFFINIDKEGRITEVGVQTGADLTGPFSVTNNIKKTTLTITKRDASGANLSGIEFDLFRVTGEIETPVGNDVTDADGQVVFAGLIGGERYIAREAGTPLTGYYKTGEHVVDVLQPGAAANPATALTPYTHIWINYPHAASIEITKVDKLRPGVVLEGAHFELYRDDGTGTGHTGPAIASETTNSNGKLVFAGLPLTHNTGTLTTNSEPALEPAVYWLVETATPEEYILSPVPIKITLDPATVSGSGNARTHMYTHANDSKLFVTNEPIAHGEIEFTFTKYSNRIAPYGLGDPLGDPLPGITFRMRDTTFGSDYELIKTSDDDGVVTFKGIPFGTYAIEEVGLEDGVYKPEAAENHKQNPPVYVSFDKDGNCTSFTGDRDPETGDYVILNKIFDPSLIITKTKADGVTPIEGVEFELCDADGNSFSPRIVEESDEEGIVTFTGLLGFDTYTVKELSALAGFYTTGAYTTGPVNQQGDYTLTRKNYEHAASLEVLKVDEAYRSTPVDGATFELYRDDGTGMRHTGDAIGSGTTGTDGKLVFTNLSLDQGAAVGINGEPALLTTYYWLIETGTKNGYKHDATPKRVALDPSAGGAVPRTHTYTDTVMNEPEYAEITYTTHNLSLNPADTGAGGTVSRDGERITAVVQEASGSTAAPAAGYSFVGWFRAGSDYTDDENSLGTSLYYKPPRDTVSGLNISGNYVAVFRENDEVDIVYSARTVSNTDGAQGPNDRGGTVSSAGERLFPYSVNAAGSTAAAKPGYTFIGWYIASDTGFVTAIETENGFVPARSGGLNAAGNYVALFKENADVAITYSVATRDNDGLTTQTPSANGGFLNKTSENVAPATGSPSSTASAYAGYTLIGWFDADDTDFAQALGASNIFVPARVADLHVPGSYVALFEENPSVTINYTRVTVGSDGTTVQDPANGGELDIYTENAAPFTGTPQSVATADPGYTLIGWFRAGSDYTDNANRLSANDSFTPPKTGGLNTAGNYVALFKEDADAAITYAVATRNNDGLTAQTPSSNGGELNKYSESVAPVTGNPSSVATAKAGYTFIGWYRASDTGFGTSLTTDNMFVPARVADLHVAGDYVALFRENPDVTINYTVFTLSNDGVTPQDPATAGGSLNKDSDVVAPYTGSPSAAATVNSGYNFVGWFADTDTTFSTPLWETLTFTPPRTDDIHTSGSYIALFIEKTGETITYNRVTVSNDGVTRQTASNGGDLNKYSEIVHPATGSPSAEAAENPGYTFMGWFAGADTGFNTPLETDKVFEPPKEAGLNVEGSYVALFKENGDVTITYERVTLGNTGSTQTASGGGSLNKAGESVAPYTGSPSAVATVNEGYEFLGWFLKADTSFGSPVGSSVSFTPPRTDEGLNAAGNYVALFKEKASVTIEYSATAGGSVSLASEFLAPVTDDATGSLAEPAPGYIFAGWYDAGDTDFNVIVSSDEMFIPARDISGLNVEGSYVARFAEKGTVTIMYIAAPGGRVSRASDVVPPATGTAVGSTATANSGYKFIGWYAGGEKVSDLANFIPEKQGGVYVAETYIAMFEEMITVVSGYRVDHYHGATLAESEIFSAVIGTEVTATPKTGYIGYTYIPSAPGEIKSGKIPASGILVLRLYYEASTFSISYVIEGGIPPGAATGLPAVTGVPFNSEQHVAGEPAFAGYIFSGWSTPDCLVQSDSSFLMPHKNVTFTGRWIPNAVSNVIPYTVEHYLDSVLYDTENLSGIIGNTVNGIVKVLTGYTYRSGPSVSSGVLEHGENLVLKLYYTLNSHSITYEVTGPVPGGAPEAPGAATAEYGSAQTVAKPLPNTGPYLFNGWHATGAGVFEGSFTMPDRDVTFTGSWTLVDEDEDDVPTTYTVIHHLDGVPYETNDFKAVAGQIVSASAMTYTGYTYNDESSTTAGEALIDGALVLDLYYEKDTYSISYSFDGPAPAGAPAVPTGVAAAEYGSRQNVENTPEHTGYVFSGWVTPDAPSSGVFSMPEKNITFIGLWVPVTDIIASGYKVEHYVDGTLKETETLKGLPGATATALPKTGYAGYTYDAGHGSNIITGTILADSSLVLRVYYAASVPVVRYEVSGAIPPGAPAGPADESRSIGDIVSVTETLFYAGYSFSGWHSADCMVADGVFTMPGHDVVFKGVWTRNPVMLTVKFIDWNSATLKTQYVPYGWDAQAPVNPSRPGFTFKGWDKKYTNITADTIVTAIYTAITAPGTPAPGGSQEAPGTPGGGGPGAAAGPAASGENGTHNTPPHHEGGHTAPFAEEPGFGEIAEEDHHVLPDEEPPHEYSQDYSWALLNLILTIITVFIALAMMLAYLIKLIRHKKNKYYEDSEDNPDNEVHAQKHVILRMIAVILVGVSILMFIFTENMIYHMIFIDVWTIWHIIFTAGAIVVARLSRKEPEEKTDEEDNYMKAM